MTPLVKGGSGRPSFSIERDARIFLICAAGIIVGSIIGLLVRWVLS